MQFSKITGSPPEARAGIWAVADIDGHSRRLRRSCASMELARFRRSQAMGFYQDRVVPHLVNWSMRNRQLAPYRERVLTQAAGRVLEIGVGSGVNLPRYTDRANEVLGLDPHPKLLAM